MYKAIFQNSRAALIFAVMTILGAVMMVGSADGDGALGKAIGRYSQSRETIVEEAHDFAEAQSVPDKVIDPAAGWGSSTPAVFGEFQAGDGLTTSDPASAPVKGPIAGPASKQARKPGAIVPGPQPVVADSIGTPAPEFVGGPAAASPPPVPVITSRQMTLEPQ